MTTQTASQYREVTQTYSDCGHPQTVTRQANAALATTRQGTCPDCRPISANCYSYGRNRSSWRVSR